MFQKPSTDIALESHDYEDSDDNIETVVGPSVHVEGDFSSAGNILVKGTVSGNVQTSRLLTVEEGAVIAANVKAGDSIISGEIQGNVHVDEKLELTESARVVGDIVCKTLVVEAGALIFGKVAMEGLQEVASKEKKRGRKKKVRSTVSNDTSGDADMADSDID